MASSHSAAVPVRAASFSGERHTCPGKLGPDEAVLRPRFGYVRLLLCRRSRSPRRLGYREVTARGHRNHRHRRRVRRGAVLRRARAPLPKLIVRGAGCLDGHRVRVRCAGFMRRRGGASDRPRPRTSAQRSCRPRDDLFAPVPHLLEAQGVGTRPIRRYKADSIERAPLSLVRRPPRRPWTCTRPITWTDPRGSKAVGRKRAGTPAPRDTRALMQVGASSLARLDLLGTTQAAERKPSFAPGLDHPPGRHQDDEPTTTRGSRA
jgi:hypothetical protein